MSHNDWIPTLCAIAGEPNMVSKLKKGYQANDKTYKVHLDGYDQSSFLRSVRVMDEVFRFAATFKEYPPRAYPPSFVPSTILEQTLHSVRRMQEEQAGKSGKAVA